MALTFENAAQGFPENFATLSNIESAETITAYRLCGLSGIELRHSNPTTQR